MINIVLKYKNIVFLRPKTRLLIEYFTIMRVLIILIITLSYQPNSSAQSTAQVGNGTGSFFRVPAYGLYDYSQAGMLYLASELSAAGLTTGAEITELSFQFTGWTSGYTLNDQVIKMSHTTEASLTDPGYPDYRSMGLRDTKTVKTSFDWVCPFNEDWEKFSLTSSFIWDGSSNILISWENYDGTWNSGYGKLKGDYINNRSHAWYSDDSYPTSASSNDSWRPNVRFGFFDFNPLPITLIHFSGSFMENNEPYVELNWETVSEQNNDFFTLWRSQNGIDWDIVQNIDGAENSNELILYSYKDRNLPVQSLNDRELYYKLSQTDLDGSAEFFPIISVLCKAPRTHVVKKTNLLGQDIDPNYKGIVIEIWNNGEISKSYWP